jgi:hypothetical protein
MRYRDEDDGPDGAGITALAMSGLGLSLAGLSFLAGMSYLSFYAHFMVLAAMPLCFTGFLVAFFSRHEMLKSLCLFLALVGFLAAALSWALMLGLVL